MSTLTLSSALEYANRGWHVFPIEPGGKRPLSQLVTKGHLDATIDPAVIAAWWGAYPDANLGISLEPSGLVVLDVDTADGKPGAASLETIAAELSATLTARTGRGGLHALYRRPDGVSPARRIGFLPGLDLLGKGYIVAAPSHLTGGGAYVWHDLEETIADLPPRLRSIDSAPPSLIASANATSPIKEGGRNDALFRLGCAIRDTGATESAVHVALLATNRDRIAPPLTDSEVSIVVASVMRTVTPSRDVAANATFAKALGIKTAEPPPPAPVAPLLSEIELCEEILVRRYSTGMPLLDAAIGGGMPTRRVLIVMAPPADGKSAWGVGVGLALDAKVPILIASTELESSELMARVAAHILGDTPWTHILQGTIDRKRVKAALAGRRVHIRGCEVLPRDATQALDLVYKDATAITERYGVPPVLIVDYLQDLIPGGDENVRGKTGDVVTALRVLSQTLDCVVIAVSSVSRAWYGAARAETMRKSSDPRIYLNAAKESGGIDYAAATVLFLDVGIAPQGSPSRPARIAVAKARLGEPAFIGARFFGASGRWIEDSTALAELTPEGDLLMRAGNDETTIVDKLTTLGPVAKSTLRVRSGIMASRADAAIRNLLAEGRIEERTDRILDSLGRSQKRVLLRLSDTSTAAHTPPDTPTRNDTKPTEK